MWFVLKTWWAQNKACVLLDNSIDYSGSDCSNEIYNYGAPITTCSTVTCTSGSCHEGSEGAFCVCDAGKVGRLCDRGTRMFSLQSIKAIACSYIESTKTLLRSYNQHSRDNVTYDKCSYMFSKWYFDNLLYIFYIYV